MTTRTFVAEEDAFVELANPDTGVNDTALTADRDPMREVLLKFRVEVSGRVTSARLLLHSVDDTSNGPSVYRADTAWSEATVSWDTRPEQGAAIVADMGSVPRSGTIELDVSSAVTEAGVVAFVLVPDSSNGLTLHSSESSSTSLRPQLIVTTDEEAPPGPIGAFTVNAAADAYVHAAIPTTNRGSMADLQVDASPSVETYLQFNLSGVTGPVTSAHLRLWVTNGTGDGPRVFRTTTGWSEQTVTWNDKPALEGDALADLDAVPSGGWVEIDVTSVVTGDGSYGFGMLPTSTDGVDFSSREASDSARRPHLRVSFSDGTSSPPGDCEPRNETQQWTRVGQSLYVRSDAPDTSYRYSEIVSVDGSPREESFLSFYVWPNGWRIKRATVRLYPTEYSVDGPALYRSTPFGWDATWNTRSTPVGSALGDVGRVSAGTFVTYDVTGIAQAIAAAPESDQTLYLTLQPTSSDGVAFMSGIGGTNAGHFDWQPQLIQDVETGPYCTYDGAGGDTAAVDQFGGANGEYLWAPSVDPNGGLVALAALPGDYGAGEWSAPDGQQGGYSVIRFDEEGEVVWSRQFPTDVYPQDLAVTPLGNTLVVGSYSGAPDLGNGPFPYASTTGLFILKLSPSNRVTWSKGFVTEDPELDRIWASSVTTDSEGNLILSGQMYGSAELGSGTLDTGNHFDPEAWEQRPAGLVAKFTWEGHAVFSRVFATPETGHGTFFGALATDPSNNIYLGGTAVSGADLGGGPISTHYMPGAVIKYSPNGALLWSRLFEGTWGEVNSLAPLQDGSVAFSFQYDGEFAFDGERYVVDCDSPECRSTFVGTLNISGGDGWAKDKIGQAGARVTVNTEGFIGVTGWSSGPTDLGGGVLGNDATQGPFVVKFHPDGTHVWSRLLDRNFSSRELLGARGSGFHFFGHFYRPVSHDGQTYSPRGQDDLLWMRFAP